MLRVGLLAGGAAWNLGSKDDEDNNLLVDDFCGFEGLRSENVLGPSWEAFWDSRGGSGPDWEPFGRFLGALGRLLGCFACFGSVLGAAWVVLGAFWVVLEPVGPSCGRLGGLRRGVGVCGRGDVSWALLVLFWRLWGPSRAPFGMAWVLGAFWAVVGASWIVL